MGSVLAAGAAIAAGYLMFGLQVAGTFRSTGGGIVAALPFSAEAQFAAKSGSVNDSEVVSRKA